MEQRQQSTQPDINLDTLEASAERYSPEKVHERILKTIAKFQLISDAIYGGLYEARTQRIIDNFESGKEEDEALLQIVTRMSLEDRTEIARIIGDLSFSLVGTTDFAPERHRSMTDSGEELKKILFPNLSRYKNKSY